MGNLGKLKIGINAKKFKVKRVVLKGEVVGWRRVTNAVPPGWV